jgi:fatty-acyl-CoA synthase
MEVPLTPLEFMRRARTCIAPRGRVDGQNRWTCDAFFDRCDRWSSVLQRMGIRKGDRVAYISQHPRAARVATMRCRSSAPCWCPSTIDCRTRSSCTAESQRRESSASRNHIDVVDDDRKQVPKVEQFVALEGARPAGSRMRTCSRRASRWRAARR